jgi:putative restriction endonuclease
VLGYVANTDFEWFTFLRSRTPPPDEVNFWRPGSQALTKLDIGEPVFFRLKAPYKAIGGFGYFAHFSFLPISMAWEVYENANGAPTFTAMRERLLRIRERFGMPTDAKQDFQIGCVLLTNATFFSDDEWVRDPSDFAPQIVGGKTYDLSHGEGQRIWQQCLARAGSPQFASRELPIPGGYGAEITMRPRLGQRSFRIAVLDSYSRRCAATNERTLPALEAAHIREYHDVQEHSIQNGISFRADIHKLFDRGYVTVTPDYHFEVSKRIKEEFENGRDYYALHGTLIRLPERASDRPAAEALGWHNENRYLG